MDVVLVKLNHQFLPFLTIILNQLSFPLVLTHSLSLSLAILLIVTLMHSLRRCRRILPATVLVLPFSLTHVVILALTKG